MREEEVTSISSKLRWIETPGAWRVGQKVPDRRHTSRVRRTSNRPLFQYLLCTGNVASHELSRAASTWQQSRRHSAWPEGPGQTAVGSQVVVFVSKTGPAWGHEPRCGHWSQILCVRACSAAQLCPTPFDPMACSPPGSSVHGILQARILE